MTEPTDAEPFNRDRLVQTARRWGPLVVLSAILAGVAAYAVSITLPPQYRATAQLFVAPVANPSVALQEVVLGQNLARSYVQLATAEVVLRPAMQKIGSTDLDAFRRSTDVAQVRDTFVITVSFVLDDSVRAADAANAIAESFVAQSRNLQAALQGTVTIWQPATPPNQRESPRVALNTVLGALSGAFIAAVVLVARSYLDDRLVDFDRVRTRLGIAPLEEIDKSARPETMTGKLFVRDSPHSREAEAFRSLRTNISFANVDKRPRSILVTSALPGEGKSVISANLALALAQEGTPTVLIDGDLRRPSQHKLFNVSGGHGLTNLLAGQLPLETLQRFRVAEHLVVIPSGPLPPNPTDLLSSERMTELIHKLANLTEGCTVVIDTSPVLAVADPLALSTKVDGCLLVIDAARTNARVARRALERLKGVNARVLGAVLNMVSVTREYYGYDYYSSDDAPKGDTPEIAGLGRPSKGAVQTSGSRAGDHAE